MNILYIHSRFLNSIFYKKDPNPLIFMNIIFSKEYIFLRDEYHYNLDKYILRFIYSFIIFIF